MKDLNHLFERNQTWARKVKGDTPEFFQQLSKQQTPHYLWIGCSDSRVPSNQLMQLPPGEIFSHRNIANLVVEDDLNCLSVIQYAVDVLKIKHIIVCGHYDCGGINAAMCNEKLGLIDSWLEHIKQVEQKYCSVLEDLDDEEKANRLCELNVIEQVHNVCRTETVLKAWVDRRDLFVHGWVYDVTHGTLKNLGTCASREDKLPTS